MKARQAGARRVSRVMMTLILSFACLYLAFTAVLYLAQRKLQYVPDTRLVEPTEAGLDGFVGVRLDTPDGERLVAWHARARSGFPTIVYFQGNGAGLEARSDRFALFQRSGYGVLAIGYRGYSGSTGTPTESGLLTDAETAVRYLGREGIPPDGLVYYGESLGTGVAVQLAARGDAKPAAVVLEAPFTSAADVARTQYWYVPVALLMKDQFRSIDHMADLNAPVFVLHGDRDGVVPVTQGRRVFAAAAEPKEMMEIPGAGHDVALTPETWRRVDAFLRRHHTRPDRRDSPAAD